MSRLTKEAEMVRRGCAGGPMITIDDAGRGIEPAKLDCGQAEQPPSERSSEGRPADGGVARPRG